MILNVLVEIFSHVLTGCSSLSASAGTQPVVPFGRTGSRTRSHSLSSTSVRSSTNTRSSVFSGVFSVSFATRLDLASGFARAIAALSTYAKNDSLPSVLTRSTFAAEATPGPAAETATAAAKAAAVSPTNLRCMR